MATVQYLIKSDLSESNNAIITYNTTSFDAVKEKINLYLNLNRGEIPFSTFGNTLVAQLFQVNNESIANEIMRYLIDDMNGLIAFSTVKIIDYSTKVYADRRRIDMILNLSNGQNLTVSV